jgi:hypothetical protein
LRDRREVRRMSDEDEASKHDWKWRNSTKRGEDDD